MYKAVRMFHYNDGIELERKALEGVCEVEEHVCSTEEDIIQYCQDADAVMGIFEPLTARVINALPNLKLIACKSMGYNYYCNVDSSKYFVQIRDRYFRQGRRNLDGYRMYYNPELLEDLFDAKSVFDPARPTPVPPMG